MKSLPFISRDFGGIVRCLDDAVASSLHTAISCHRVAPASSHTVTCFFCAETSRHHTVQSLHRAEISSHGIVTAFLYTETSRHGTVTASLHTETLRHHAVLEFNGAVTSLHSAKKSILHAAKSSGGIALAKKSAKNGQNRAFGRSNRKY
jgi:hypothetical protein